MNVREYNLRAAFTLKERFQEAIRAGHSGQVNLSNQSHHTITEVLHEFVYTDRVGGHEPRYVHVRYSDGSQGEPFPLYCLPRRCRVQLSHLKRIRPLRAALISMRHLEMDHRVDIAWFLNQDVSKAPTLAEVDTYCYLQTRRQLWDALTRGMLQLHLYQTGFQPTVVGFYRALVEVLLQQANRSPALEVTPFYFSHLTGSYWPGRAWN